MRNFLSGSNPSKFINYSVLRRFVLLRRLLELESKDQENMQMQRALHKLMEEERDKLVKKRSEQTVLRVRH